ncbi:MAG: isoaspartyl peptidase/L-asparaginase family protein [Gemmataceae bacterium]
MRAISALACLTLLITTTNSQPPKTSRTILVIHGGAGVLTDAEMKLDNLTRQDFERGLTQSLAAGYEVLKQGKSSTDAVEAAIRVIEDSELFNAGRGAAFTSDGRVELDAAIMEGKMDGQGEGKQDPRKRAGAVTGVTHVKNPISAARAVMDDGRHVLLAGDGAEALVLSDANRAKYHLERVSNINFWTDRRVRQIRQRHTDSQKRFGTVGAVALDRNNNLACGTSTGGLTGKLPGRIGDSPILGAGTYVDNRACGVSCTGTGEIFIRHAVAHDVVARMLYKRSSLADAARETIAELPDEEDGVGGLIALDREGRHTFAMSKKTTGIYRGFVTEDGQIFVGLLANEAEKRP